MAANTDSNPLCDTEDGIMGTFNSQYAAAAESDVSAEVFSYVKNQVGNFAQHCNIAIKVLDELAKAHPFINSKSPSTLEHSFPGNKSCT